MYKKNRYYFGGQYLLTNKNNPMNIKPQATKKTRANQTRALDKLKTVHLKKPKPQKQ